MRPRMSQPVCRTERSSRNALVRLMAQAEEFLRLYQTGFVAMWPVLGHATTDRWSIRTVVAVVCVSCWFNIFGGLLNDVCDLHSDRADPSRSDRWLVNGTVSVRCALAIVGLQLPLLLITHALSGFPPLPSSARRHTTCSESGAPFRRWPRRAKRWRPAA
jgi:4-hydroxybenzoate polyprenyltransferase